MASTIDKSIEFLQSHAEDALGRASALAGRIGSWAAGPSDIQLKFAPAKPDLRRPLSFGDLLESNTSQATIKFLDAEGDKWMEKYFPELSSAGSLRNTPEQWVAGILTGTKPFGLSKEAFDAIWHEGRDRAYRAAGTEQATLRADFSRRGFSIPPGAMIGAMNESEIRASEAIADVNRQQNSRNAEIKAELIKFAAEKAITLKAGVMSELATFYRSWLETMNRDTDIARSKVQAYAALSASLSAYHNTELGFEELRLRAAIGDMDAQVHRTKAVLQEGEVRASTNNALAQATRAFGDVSAAAANAQSSLQADIYSGSA